METDFFTPELSTATTRERRLQDIIANISITPLDSESAWPQTEEQAAEAAAILNEAVGADERPFDSKALLTNAPTERSQPIVPEVIPQAETVSWKQKLARRMGRMAIFERFPERLKARITETASLSAVATIGRHALDASNPDLIPSAQIISRIEQERREQKGESDFSRAARRQEKRANIAAAQQNKAELLGLLSKENRSRVLSSSTKSNNPRPKKGIARLIQQGYR